MRRAPSRHHRQHGVTAIGDGNATAAERPWITDDRFWPNSFVALPAAANAGRRLGTHRTILLDLGASMYGLWREDRPTELGTRWFVERYARHCERFDQIIAFEFDEYNRDKIYRDVPSEVLPSFTYINVGVEGAPNGRWSPWRWLRSVALIQQLLNDTSLLALIDEMFYEHHTSVAPMASRGWGTGLSETLADSCTQFTALRKAGVRMHSWP